MFNYSSSRDTLNQLNDDSAKDLLPVMVFIGLLMVPGLFSNLAVCFIFGFRLRMNTQHFMIVTLAVIELFSCLIVMPTEIANLRYHYSFRNELVCRMTRFASTFYGVSSVLTLVVIAVDRYLKICRPRKRQISMAQAKMAVAGLLLVSLIISSPFMMLFTSKQPELEHTKIMRKKCDISIDPKIIIGLNIVLLLTFFVVFITLTFIYVCIWRYMKRHNEYMTGSWTVSSNLTSAEQAENSTRDCFVTSLPETPQLNVSMHSVDNIKDTVLGELDTAKLQPGWCGELDTGNKGRETCPANNKDVSNPSTDNRDIYNFSTDNVDISNPFTDNEDIFNPLMNMCSPSPLAMSEGKEDMDSMSVLEEDSQANISYLLMNNSNNGISLQNADPTPVILANSPPIVVGETTNTSAGTSSTLTIPSNEYEDRGMPMAAVVSRRSLVLEVNTYKATVIAMSITFFFGISFLSSLALSWANLIVVDLERTLNGASLCLFHIFLRSYLINSVSNPIIYGVFNVRFRNELLLLVRELQICQK